MGKIHTIEKQTENRFLNMYNVKATSVHNTPVNYFVASRAESIERLKIDVLTHAVGDHSCFFHNRILTQF